MFTSKTQIKGKQIRISPFLRQKTDYDSISIISEKKNSMECIFLCDCFLHIYIFDFFRADDFESIGENQ